MNDVQQALLTLSKLLESHAKHMNDTDVSHQLDNIVQLIDTAIDQIYLIASEEGLEDDQ